MCLLAKIYEFYLKKNNKSLVVIGATSGDTGSAAIHAFQNLKNIKICILHPHNGTSEFQRKQMTTTGSDNVFNIALEGTFDDCQSIVKKAFNDSELTQDQSFTAVNSINWFRILPQTIYYAWALSNYGFTNFVVPTGNFGNIYAAYILKKMGFPISNNDLSIKKVLKTNSPSMDIVISSNFERLIHDFIGPEKTKEVFSNIGLKNNSLRIDQRDYIQISEFFKSGMASSLQVTEEIRKTFQISHVVMDPHTAVGVSVARSLNLDNTCALACAHPVKFQETVIASIGDTNSVFDKSISFNNSERYDILGNDYDVFKNYIIKNAKS
jgi:threonine synthase